MGSRPGSQGCDNGGCSPAVALSACLLVLSCPPGNLSPAAAHYTRNVSLGRTPGVWWHINNGVTTGPGHLRVINVAHKNPSHAPPPPHPQPQTPTPMTAAAGPTLSQSLGDGVCVSMCVCVCVSWGGEFMGSWCLINLSDMHTNSSCFVCHGLSQFV